MAISSSFERTFDPFSGLETGDDRSAESHCKTYAASIDDGVIYHSSA